MTSPEVTVVLPVFNRLNFLRPAVASVVAQTFPHWELIVADDGSSGETAAYLRALADPPRVRVLQLRHTGNPGAVRNAALPAARGEYIAFLDSDDLWLPQKLAQQIASLRAHPHRSWSHTAFAAIDDTGKLLTEVQARAWPAAEGWVLEKLITTELVIAPASVVVTRRVLEELGGFDTRQRACEDYDLWLRLARLSEIDGVAQTLTLKRCHQQPFYTSAMVFEDRARALEKLLAVKTDRSLRAVLRRERAKVAAGLACVHAVCGGRRAALRTLAKSSRYSWGYWEWWLGGVRAAVHALTPAGVLRVVRAVVRRSPPVRSPAANRSHG
jgi:glycosyltransferase involved in cell wall biosynthesis